MSSNRFFRIYRSLGSLFVTLLLAPFILEEQHVDLLRSALLSLPK